jgi:site-specific DNA recombinase
MISAIYARKSTEQNGVADEAKSVARQIEHAKVYAAKKGWPVAEDHIYTDDGISGAEFEKRPQLMRLIADVGRKPRPFDVLVISEKSRLGREAWDVGYYIKKIVRAGVRIVSYLDGKEVAFETATERMMESMLASVDDLERERASQRTFDAMLRKAKAGHVTGGTVFGYTNARAAENGHVERRINDVEAAVIHRVFTMAAAGAGVKRIAAALNAEGAPAPTPRRLGRPRGWSPSTVRDVLYRELYRGGIVWNRSRKRDAWGQKRQRRRDETEWLRVEAPALRIVPEALWTDAHARMAAAAAVYRQRTGGRAFGRPANGVESHYLLTGLGACAACGGSMAVLKRAHGPRGNRQQVPFYGCMTRHLRGEAVCQNALEVRLVDAEQAVLAAVEHDLLNVAVLETSLYKAIAALQDGDGADVRLTAMRDELARIDAEVGRLAQAIAQGGNLPALVALLQVRERRRAQVRAALAEVERKRTPHGAVGDLGQALAAMRGALTDWQGLLRQETGPARQALRALLQGRLVFAPQARESARFYRFEGAGTISPVIAGSADLQKVWCPRGDIRDRGRLPFALRGRAVAGRAA